jgi:hypothetical protein
MNALCSSTLSISSLTETVFKLTYTGIYIETLHKHSIVSLETVALRCSLIDSIKAKTRLLVLQRDRRSVCPL